MRAMIPGGTGSSIVGRNRRHPESGEVVTGELDRRENSCFGEITTETERAVPGWRIQGVDTAIGQCCDNAYCGIFVVHDGCRTEVC